MSLVWITGLSGSGKTTLATALITEARRCGLRCTRIDGNDFRRDHAPTLGFDRKDRLRCAELLTRHGHEMHAETDVVIIATISLFHHIHALNRRLHQPYLEVLLDVAPEVLLQRRPPAARAPGPWVGDELPAEFPRAPHLTLRNQDPQDLVDNVQRLTQALRGLHVA